jgi:predicted phage replisome organizer
MAKGKKYYWLKLKEDFFKTREIKKLRTVAGGDTFTIIYLKLQLLSIKQDGIIAYEGTEESIQEQLALELDEEVENVRLTLSYLSKNNLLEELNDTEYLLNKVPEMIGNETDAAERMRKLREEKKKRNNVTPELQEVTESYTEIEIEKELELEREKEKELDIRGTRAPQIPYQNIVDAYNELSLPNIIKLSDKRKKLVQVVVKEYTLDDIYKVFELVEQSPFLIGESDRGWKADFDWLFNKNNFLKVLEGRYKDKKKVVESDEFIPTNFKKRL